MRERRITPVLQRQRWTRAILVLTAAVLLGGCREPAGRENEAAEAAAGVRGPDTVAVPGGWFEMGSPDESEPDEKLHRVYVSPFLIDRYPVTQEAYAQLIGKNPSHWRGPRHPVDQIRWRDAAAYCNARSQAEGLSPAYDPQTWECDFAADGYRLPTEAEYEYALRAGTTSEFYFGDSPQELTRYAWFKENSPRGSHPVGQKAANPWGLHDMTGNVWEWCHDYYQEDYYAHSPARDPHGPPRGESRVVRGGCWNSKPDHCRSAYRNYELAAFTDTCFAKDIHGQIGFRCVRREPVQHPAW